MPGHIRKRGQSSWTVIVDLGNDPTTGKRRQLWRSVKGPKREAEALLVQLLHERDTGVEQPRGKLTVAAFLDRWLDDFVEPNLAPKTCRQPTGRSSGSTSSRRSGRSTSWRSGHRTSSRSTRDCSSRDAGRSGRAVEAVGPPLPPDPPCRAAPGGALAAPRPQSGRRGRAAASGSPRTACHDAGSGRAVMAAADETPYGPFVRLALLTGRTARRTARAPVGRRRPRRRGAPHPADGAADRRPGHRLPAAEDAPVAALDRPVARGRRAAARPPTPAGRGASARGSRVRRSRPRLRHRARDADRAGEPSPVVADDHAGGGRARPPHPRSPPRARDADARQGVHPKVVSERLGHACVNITLDTYSHVLPGLQEAAAAALDTILDGARDRRGPLAIR